MSIARFDKTEADRGHEVEDTPILYMKLREEGFGDSVIIEGEQADSGPDGGFTSDAWGRDDMAFPDTRRTKLIEGVGVGLVISDKDVAVSGGENTNPVERNAIADPREGVRMTGKGGDVVAIEGAVDHFEASRSFKSKAHALTRASALASGSVMI